MSKLALYSRDELRQSLFGLNYLRLNRITRRSENRFLRKVVSKEGGVIYSYTFRLLLEKRHMIKLGSYSYGELDDLYRFPINTTIGRYTSIGPGVKAFAANHPYDFISMHPFFYRSDFGYVETEMIRRGSLNIGNDVWIGCNSIICPGCNKIGNGVVIAAGSVVTKDVPEFCIVAGNPAKVIKKRFDDDLGSKINEIEWWNHSIDYLKNYSHKMSRNVQIKDLDGFWDVV